MFCGSTPVALRGALVSAGTVPVAYGGCAESGDLLVGPPTWAAAEAAIGSDIRRDIVVVHDVHHVAPVLIAATGLQQRIRRGFA